MRTGVGAVLSALALVAVCGGTALAAGASFSAHGSAEQVYVTGLGSGQRAVLLNAAGRTVQTASADSLGGLVFRNVRPGSGYRVRPRGGPPSGPLTVLSNAPAPPSTSIYNQTLPARGYGYLTTRDGTKLAIDVHLPQDVSQRRLPGGIQLGRRCRSTGRTPTLIEYSGYGYADPAGRRTGSRSIANLMGFAVVDVNMRGTGCSGGAYDFFEPLQNLDGYDVIETVAHQPWVAAPQGRDDGHLLRRDQPAVHRPDRSAEPGRDLAAVGDRQHADDALPGRHPQHRLRGRLGQGARPRRLAGVAERRPGVGATSASSRAITTCKANQVLHGEAINLMAKIRANSHYVPSVADPLSPITFVNKINVPVYMACQWTDEQTGGHCPDLAEHFTGTAAASGSRSRTGPTSTRSTRRRSTAGMTSCELYVAQQAPIDRLAPSIHARRAGHLPVGDGHQRR